MARVESIKIILTQKSMLINYMGIGKEFLILIIFFLFPTDRCPLKKYPVTGSFPEKKYNSSYSLFFHNT